MADKTAAPVVHIGENSPEKVALDLLNIIVTLEGRQLYKTGNNPADRKWFLDTYVECLRAVRGYR